MTTNDYLAPSNWCWQAANPFALLLQLLTMTSSWWTVSVSVACCLCRKVLLSVELPSSAWSWLTSWLCLSTSSWNCCFSLSKLSNSLTCRASSANSLCSRKLPMTGREGKKNHFYWWQTGLRIQDWPFTSGDAKTCTFSWWWPIGKLSW